MFSKKTVEFGEKLLHHQLWFFGKDISHKDGNLLIQYGFERFGVPEGKSGGTSYRLTLNDTQELALFGFGVFFGDKKSGGIFLKRYEFQPKLLKCTNLNLPIWKSDLLPNRYLPTAENEVINAKIMFTNLANLILEYELWIDANCGKQWRKSCLKDWENAEFGIRKIRNSWNKIQTM
jgi:hypothetical protein